MAESAPKRRRLQAGASCESCRKRKSRCDAARPQCSNCSIRGTQCDYVAHRPSLATEEGDVYPGARWVASQQTTRPLAAHITHGLEHQYIAAEADNSLPTSRKPHNALIADTSPASRAYFGNSSTFTFAPEGKQDEEGGRSSRPAEPSFPFINSASDSAGISDLASLEGSFDLPSRGDGDRFVDAYFNRVHKLYPVLHEGTFRAEYETMWEHPLRPYDHSRLPWFGVLNMVFAHGCEFAGTIDRDAIPAVAAPFAQRSRMIVLSHVLKPTTLEMVQVLLLLCYYLQGTEELDECWNLAGLMIRAATSLGMHLNPEADQFLPIERELRKRAWWACVGIDRTLSMKFGRPLTMRVEEGGVDLPLEVDDQYITNDSRMPRQPIGTPSFISFFNSTVKLSHIIYNILTELYIRGIKEQGLRTDMKFQTPASKCSHILSKVVLLDGQLQSWSNNAPSHLVQEPVAGQGNGINWESQRTVMKIRYLHLRLILHRPTFFYFSRNRVRDDFCRPIAISATKICINSALQTIQLITKSYPLQHLNSFWFNIQYVFTSMCVLCILSRMDDEQRSCLDESHRQENTEDRYQDGMKFLEAASISSPLATKYIAILQQLRGGHGHHRDVNGLGVHTKPSDHASSALSPVSEDTQGDGTDWGLHLNDLFSGVSFDFTDMDDLLFGTEASGYYSTGTWEPLTPGVLGTG